MRSALLATQKTLKQMGPKAGHEDLPAFTPLHFTLPPLPAEEQRAVATEVKKQLPWENIARRAKDLRGAEALYSTAPERPAEDRPASITWRNGLPPPTPRSAGVAARPTSTSSSTSRPASREGGGRPGSRGGSARKSVRKKAKDAGKAGSDAAEGCPTPSSQGMAAGDGDGGTAGLVSGDGAGTPGHEMFTASLQAPKAAGADGGAPMMYAFPTPGGPSAEMPSLPAPTPSLY